MHGVRLIQRAPVDLDAQLARALDDEPRVGPQERAADDGRPERGRADFPFLRNFDAYAGHSWAGGDGISISLTGASAMWSDFNTANRDAMMKSELYSWPVTLAILALDFVLTVFMFRGMA